MNLTGLLIFLRIFVKQSSALKEEGICHCENISRQGAFDKGGIIAKLIYNIKIIQYKFSKRCYTLV